MTIHSVKGLRISDEVHAALKVRAAETGETMGEIAERALRKELGMVEKVTWQVIEDNGGGLHLAVFSGDDVIYYASGYESNEESLRADLKDLREGSDPRHGGWETQTDEPQAAYDSLTSHEYGWTVVADESDTYYDRMGAAAQRVFGYRAAVYVAEDGTETVLTGPEQSHLSEPEMLEAAMEEAHDAGLIGPEYPQVPEDVFRDRLSITIRFD